MKFIFFILLAGNLHAEEIKQKTIMNYCEVKEMGDLYYVKSCAMKTREVLNKKKTGGKILPHEQVVLQKLEEMQSKK